MVLHGNLCWEDCACLLSVTYPPSVYRINLSVDHRWTTCNFQQLTAQSAYPLLYIKNQRQSELVRHSYVSTNVGRFKY